MQAQRCKALEDEVAARADTTSDTLESMQRELAASQEATLRSHRETLARIDVDGDGSITAGEFLKFVRRGWAAFVQEQERLSALGNDLLGRPNWVDTAAVHMDKPIWPEQTMTLQVSRALPLTSPPLHLTPFVALLVSLTSYLLVAHATGASEILSRVG